MSKIIFVLCIDAFKDKTLEEGIKLDITSEILEVCIKFMHYKVVNRKVSCDRPPFPIAPEKALDVLKASIYL